MNATATREIRRVRLRALARLSASDAFRARTRQCDGARGDERQSDQRACRPNLLQRGRHHSFWCRAAVDGARAHVVSGAREDGGLSLREIAAIIIVAVALIVGWIFISNAIDPSAAIEEIAK